ncbi:peptidase inhibitor family I36 protein [Glycomyces xiaoerkulensis]|uniref:peptidase inhibitor family I36 protein n=1 Tax=Glycomyces xiaoerkulensis TaxID=2038139 RepID=UPI000C261112|nr:peptidase inhibitor family I36 protein [Glycomyces xiaoerkulensis]
MQLIKSNRRGAVALALAVLMGAAAALAAVSPAQAATARNGICESGEFCLYYNSNNQGSVSDFDGSITNYGPSQPTCYEYRGSGNGKGQCVKNNAASAWNRTGRYVTVFYNSGYKGPIDNFSPGAKANLRSYLKNDNAGHRIGASGNAGDNLEYRLYHSSSARVTSYFDGYVNTSGRHEGIDIKRGVGYNVYSLLSGTVTNVREGSRGSGGLSTLAIYNSSLNRTIVYLHLNPLNGIDAGDHISSGQRIGLEDWRGISSSGASHTHFEMRPGRQTHAAKSVGDYTLSNPTPTNFWIARGYNPCCRFS